MSNDLEKAIIRSAKKAHGEYHRITGGYWLMHGPESFLQNFLAIDISRTQNLDTNIFPECTPTRLKREFDKKHIGRPPAVNNQQRFDIVFWWKQRPHPRALLEIKLTNSRQPVVDDAEKLRSYKKEAARLQIRHGYLLVYSEARRNVNINRQTAGADTLFKRFTNWETELKQSNHPFILVDRPFVAEEETPLQGSQWSYGFGLYRMDYSNGRAVEE
jgi:hypothetical protein